MGCPRLLLEKGVDLLHAGQGLLEDHLCHALISDRLLVVRILRLAILRSPLHLLLHLSHSSSGGVNFVGEVSDGLLEVSQLRFQGGLGVVTRLRFALVGGELLDAPIAVGDFVGLLLLELCDHLVDFLFDLRKGIELGASGEECELRSSGGGGCLHQNTSGAAQTVLVQSRFVQLQEGIHGLIEVCKGLVVVENLDGVLDGGNLLQAILHSLVELGFGLGAFGLEVCKESLVKIQLGGCVLLFLEGLGMLLLQGCDLLVELGSQLPASCDLVLFGGLEGGEASGLVGLLRLELAQVAFEVLLHLLEDAIDLPALRRVALVARDAEEGGAAGGLHQKGSKGHCAGGTDGAAVAEI
mmetsp:Transcript_2207/g.5205  ORF Transcript_2207/g.5205 Transcript_2207/m.5205 type:complete len:354 (+) Transcript_2207:517-1578(+)